MGLVGRDQVLGMAGVTVGVDHEGVRVPSRVAKSLHVFMRNEHAQALRHDDDAYDQQDENTQGNEWYLLQLPDCESDS